VKPPRSESPAVRIAVKAPRTESPAVRIAVFASLAAGRRAQKGPVERALRERRHLDRALTRPRPARGVS